MKHVVLTVLAMLTFFLNSCSKLGNVINGDSSNPTSTTLPAALPNPSMVVPSYIHYFPLETSYIRLEFDYPGFWLFTDEIVKDTEIQIISLRDPQFLAVPTRAPGESHGTPSDFGSITIWIIPGKPDQTSEYELESHKHGYSNIHWMKVLDDYRIQIDRYDAYVLEYQINDPEHYTSPMFARRTYFMVEDHVYEIIFEVAEKDRGGEFEKGYEYFLNSLKIVP
jgi:hypothetical protein